MRNKRMMIIIIFHCQFAFTVAYSQCSHKTRAKLIHLKIFQTVLFSCDKQPK